jgi:RNA polymerase sigma-70 factor (ECF subfamily)
MHYYRALDFAENSIKLLASHVRAFGGPGSVVASRDRIPMLEALRTLSADHRAVIVVTYYRRQCVPAAGEILGVPASIVKSRCYDALRALRQALAEQGPQT